MLRPKQPRGKQPKTPPVVGVNGRGGQTGGATGLSNSCKLFLQPTMGQYKRKDKSSKERKDAIYQYYRNSRKEAIMTFAQYLEDKRELLQAMVKVRRDWGCNILKEDAYKERLCNLFKKDYDLDLEYGKEIGFFPAK